MFPCPRCKSAASMNRGQASGRIKFHRLYKCMPARGGCGLVFTTHEMVQRNKALEQQLTADQMEWMFGKPKFKYRSVPPAKALTSAPIAAATPGTNNGKSKPPSFGGN